MLTFGKPAITIHEQVLLLKRRGMIVRDEASARHYLQFLPYYRLRAYWLPFEDSADENGSHAFRQNTTFEAVLELYRFDRRLRLLLLDAIEQVGISLRGQWAYNIAIRYGPVGILSKVSIHAEITMNDL